MTPRPDARALALACLLHAAGLPASVLAADFPAPPSSPPDEVFFWDGSYAGVHAGLVRDTADLHYSWFDSATMKVPEPYAAKVNASGFGGGIYAGWNRTLGPVVTGFEGDVTLRTAQPRSTLSGPSARLGMRFSDDVSGSLRVRVGYPVGRLLLFVTAGVAMGQPGMRAVDGSYSPPPDGNTLGWAAGLGLDYAVTDRIIARLDYLHSDFGTRSRTQATTRTLNGATVSTAVDNDRLSVSQDVVRAGVAYKF